MTSAPATAPEPSTEPLTDHQPVLVAVAADGSWAAVRHASVEAERRGCALQVMHVVDLHAKADDVLDRAVRAAHELADGRLHVTSARYHGGAVDGLVAATARTQLLVIEGRAPVPGRPLLRAPLISGSRAPVVCVPEGWDATRRTGRVTVGVHDTLTCGPLIDAAMDEAAARGAQLRILHIEPEADDGLAARELATTLADPVRRGFDGELVVSVVTGRPAAVLLAASATSDLLVVGRHHPFRPGGSQLGRVARRVLRDAQCPVLLPTPRQSVSSAVWVFAGHLD